MQVSRYRFVVYLQLFLLFVDIFVNSFAALFSREDVVALVSFVPPDNLYNRAVAGYDSALRIQDVCLVFALIVLFLVFFSTYVFQAGLIYLLVRKFKTTILVTVFYLGLSVSLHVWTMTRRWGVATNFIWIDSFQALYVIQRFASVLYYYLYKKTVLKLGDPRYYRDTEWLRKEFARVH